jgi:hypothetical protein
MDVDRLKEKAEDDGRGASLTNREYTFFVKVESCGEVFKGTFTNRILNNNEKAQRDVIAARMRQGLPWESFSPDARLRQDALSHLLVSLDKERPDWAENLGEIDDLAVVMAIYEEVMKHEDTFRGPRKNQESGAGQPGIKPARKHA